MSVFGTDPKPSPPAGETPLARLLAERNDLWRGQHRLGARIDGISTGFPPLDRALPWGGWPTTGLTEILTDQPGAGLALILPALAGLCGGRGRMPHDHDDRSVASPEYDGCASWLCLVNPPLVPYPPALDARGIALERLLLIDAPSCGSWAMEQGLRIGSCALIVGWTASSTGTKGLTIEHEVGAWSTAALRRLQLAAAEARIPTLLLRPTNTAKQPSPSMLRLKVCADAAELAVTLHKVRGARAGSHLRLSPIAHSLSRSDNKPMK
jgi:hypothetical protein